ncbi:MAG: hypothetical protein K0U36_00640 [Alphaproteobacteria bacterium]|nr:hypothetical protein [Alphaproteobacteria bacterium]
MNASTFRPTVLAAAVAMGLGLASCGGPDIAPIPDDSDAEQQRQSEQQRKADRAFDKLKNETETE